ncbi:MAG: ATP-binding protein [Vicinamibacterales bacterium]
MTSRLSARLASRLGVVCALGLACALLVAAGGTIWTRAYLGRDDADAFARVEAEVRERLDGSARTLAAVSQDVGRHRALIRQVLDDTTRAPELPALFEALARAVPSGSGATTGITVYDSTRVPMAWAGRVFEFPSAPAPASTGLFVQADPFGPRLVRIETLTDVGPRPVVVVAEQRLGDVRSVPGQSTTFSMRTRLAPVTIAVPPHASAASDGSAHHVFVVRNDKGAALVEGTIARADVDAARAVAGSWRRAALGVVGALTLLGAAAVLLEARRRARTARAVLGTSGLLAALLVGARLLLRAGGPQPPPGWLAPPIDLPLTALLLLSLAWLVLDLLDRWRLGLRSRPPIADRGRAAGWTAVGFFLAGGVTAGTWITYAGFLRSVARLTSFDVLQFSLHPFSWWRVVTALGLVLLHAAVVWGAASATRLVAVARRRHRSGYLQALAVLTWLLGAAAMLSLVERWRPSLPTAWLLVATGAVGLAAAALARPRGAMRRGSQAARLGVLYLALLLPSFTTYPLLQAFAAEAKEQRIADEYGPMAARQREDLKDRLGRTLEQIDARPLPAVTDPPGDAVPDAQPAFDIWRSTDLGAYRLTSAIELYGVGGRLASRFALRLPETAPITYRDASCDWDVLDEVSPFGSSERRVLRASRALCLGGRRQGAIVVRVMLDPRTLPFIRAESPYLAALGPGQDGAAEAGPSRDIEFVAYGWSRVPINTSGSGVWPLSDAVFDRLVRTRVPFWETLERQGVRYRVHFLSDRGGIYALGYPLLPPFGHVINLAEIAVLAGVAYVVLLAGATMVSGVASGGLSGRALLREVRSSFYRKLVAAFVLIAAVPVFVLAIATRTYFAAQARAGVEADAIKTVTVAQRLVEDYALIQRGEASAFDTLDDQTMVLVGRAIDQTVNLFDRDRLQATSERDLFASALLTPRTSAAVYRNVVLRRLPVFVGEEEVNGSPYLVAAAPVRTGDRDGIVTVPQTLRQREIESQIDELNRQVISAAVLFVLIGAAIGYWMAERIADPVNRLTRATRRIARGDLDARIAATSSDELRRLVDDFNRMAADLKRQRTELERTQRLEAWADMARQVAHDIKNPLTPIQLSAEHLQRVNADRGRPLSPVIDECVSAILSQVRLLRQISTEFSSFASAPTPRPESTDLVALVAEVVEPYRTALADRVALVVEADPGLPAILVDRTLFGRALTNVIENALHAMPGGGHLAIGVVRSAEAPEVVVTVRDSGVGMDAEALARVFQPYFSTKARGTGLGLTIAKRNVELNGGRIGVASERGAGTTVTITLPCPA